MYLSSFFGTCPELFRGDPSVSSKSTFSHAYVPITLEDVIRAWNQFSDHFFSDVSGFESFHDSTPLRATTTTTMTWSCGGSSCSSTFLRRDDVVCGGLFVVLFFFFNSFLKCNVTMVLPSQTWSDRHWFRPHWFRQCPPLLCEEECIEFGSAQSTRCRVLCVGT